MNVLNKVKQILQGWWYRWFPNPEIEKIAAERMRICANCPFIDFTGKHCAVPKTEPCCSDCGCSLAAATRSPEYSCPKNKW
jgi:hypothetical protein